MRQREEMRGPVAETQRNAGQRDGHNSEQNRAANSPSHENGDEQKACGGKKDLRVGHFAETNEGRRIGYDNSGVAQTDEGNEETNARGGAVFEAIGNAVYDLLANVGEREEQEEQAREEDDAESGLPRDAAADHDGVGEVGVERHAGSESDRIVGPEPQDECVARVRDAGGKKIALDGHNGLGEN